MTTSDLIALLKKHEFGGATGKPREVDLNIPGYGFISDLNFSVNSTDDGLYTAICFDVTPGTFYPEGMTELPPISLEGYALTHEDVERMINNAEEELQEIRKELGFTES